MSSPPSFFADHSSKEGTPLRITIASLFGENCITAEDGEVLREKIAAALDAEQKVELDFAGVSVVSTPFFNVAVGELMRNYDRDTLNAGVVFENLSSDATSLLVRVVKNARDYFRNPKVREAVDEMHAEQSGEHRI
jgi:hypothetical protein